MKTILALMLPAMLGQSIAEEHGEFGKRRMAAGWTYRDKVRSCAIDLKRTNESCAGARSNSRDRACRMQAWDNYEACRDTARARYHRELTRLAAAEDRLPAD